MCWGAAKESRGRRTRFGYTYNLGGLTIDRDISLGAHGDDGYDAANRPLTTTGMLAGQQTGYNAQTGYAAQGAVASYAYGNSLVPVYTYNNRLQPKEIDATIGNDPNRYLLSLTYDWGTARNNGTLQGGSEGYGPAVPYSSLSWFSQTYTYDGVNRLNSVSDTGYSRAFCSDAFGNIWVTGYTGIVPLGNTPQMINGPCPSSTTPYQPNNRINGGSYDAAGNQRLVNGNALLYDAENRLISETDSSTQAMETLAYDGEGRRVSKTNPGGTTIYVHDALGQLAAEYWTATNTPACTTCYLVWDHLGSTRLVTDSAATVIARHDYLPFGEEIGPDVRGSGWGSTTDVTQKFTGKERDQEMQLDYFGARYYGSALGRFTSPDWSEQPDTVPYAEFENPQTLNLYSYARNNPLTYNDPDGHDVNVCLNDENGNQHCTQMTNEQYAAASQGNAGTNVPTLDQVGMNGNGSGSFNATNITDSNGNSIGTATYVSNGGADYYANRNGINFLSYQTAPVVNGLAYATGGVMAGAGIGAGYGAFAGGSALITLGSIPAGLQPGAVVGGFVLTEHAVEQAAERGVTLQDIEEAVEGVAKGNPNPARAWDSVVRFYGANCEVRVNRITGTIITVIKKSNK